MHLFSKKPTLETLLQRIYTDGYSNRLKSIVHESAFEQDKAIEAWKHTLASISAGMAEIDGKIPVTSQEKGLYISITDMQRECRQHIEQLTAAAQAAGKSPEPLVDLDGASSPPLVFNHEFPKHEYTGGNSSYPDLTTLSVTQSEPHLTKMPSVSDMPYKMYSRKPKLVGSRPLPTRPASSPPQTIKSQTKPTAKETKPSAAPQATTQAAAPKGGHSMRTLRGPRKRDTKGNRIDPLASRNAALNAAKQSVQMQMSTEFQGFDGCHLGDTGSAPDSPISPTEMEFQQSNSRPQSPLPLASQPAVVPQVPRARANGSLTNDAPPAKDKIQVVYEKVTNSSGKVMQIPRVIRVPANQSNPPSAKPTRQPPQVRKPVGHTPRTTQPSTTKPVRTSAPPASQQAPRTPQLQQQGSKSITSGGTNSYTPSPMASPSPMPSPARTMTSDNFDERAKHALETMKGVDKTAAEQILNEIVIKGDEVEWEDIAGLEKAKNSLKETVVYPFLRPDLFMGLREPVLGMLLFGPPGTGKTMLARAVATESRSTFFSISASSLTSKYMGESEKLVRALFQMARALAPSIIFVDEIDSILTQRQDSGEHEASRRIKNEFLVQWSDLQAAAAGKPGTSDDSRRVLVLGATNLPWAIDEAARRRFVRRQYIPLPEPETRKAHIEKLLSRQTHALSDTDISRLVDLTQGYSGSDLTALAKDAAMGPLRALGDALLTAAAEQVRPIAMRDFLNSMQTIRPSVSPENLKQFENWASLYGSSGA